MVAEHHNMYGTPTYKSWSEMKYRCGNLKRNNYINVSYCEDWKDFRIFFRDMGARPKGTTLDRIDVNKGYSKDNCRWADNHTQATNKTNSKYLTFNNKTLPLSDWAIELGIKRSTLAQRIYVLKWDIEKALTYKKRRRLP